MYAGAERREQVAKIRCYRPSQPPLAEWAVVLDP